MLGELPPIGALLNPARSRETRPRLMTAIGIMSLIVPFLSIIASGIAGILLIGMWGMNNLARPNVSSRPPAIANSPADPVSANMLGIPNPHRTLVANALMGMRWLSPERSEQLDRLLADCGRQIFPSPDGLPSIEQVKESIVEAGKIDSQQSPRDAEGPVDVFVLKTGRIELYDDHAMFTPADGRPAQISSAGISPMQAEPVQADPRLAPLPLPPADAQAVLSHARDLSSQPLTDAQLTALQGILVTPEQRLVVPSSEGAPAAAQLSQVTVDPSGRAFFTFDNGSLVLSQYGKVLSQASWMVVTSSNRAASWLFVLAMAQLLLSMLLALYLMVTGILTLREFPWAGRMHWIYIIVKLQLCVLGVFAWLWLVGEFTMQRGNSNLHMIWSGSPWGAALAAAGAIYPLLLIILLRTRSAREYYRRRFEQG